MDRKSIVEAAQPSQPSSASASVDATLEAGIKALDLLTSSSSANPGAQYTTSSASMPLSETADMMDLDGSYNTGLHEEAAGAEADSEDGSEDDYDEGEDFEEDDEEDEDDGTDEDLEDEQEIIDAEAAEEAYRTALGERTRACTSESANLPKLTKTVITFKAEFISRIAAAVVRAKADHNFADDFHVWLDEFDPLGSGGMRRDRWGRELGLPEQWEGGE